MNIHFYGSMPWLEISNDFPLHMVPDEIPPTRPQSTLPLVALLGCSVDILLNPSTDLLMINSWSKENIVN